MNYCSNCGKKLNDSSFQYCPNCGKQIYTDKEDNKKNINDDNNKNNNKKLSDGEIWLIVIAALALVIGSFLLIYVIVPRLETNMVRNSSKCIFAENCSNCFGGTCECRYGNEIIYCPNPNYNE